MFKVWMEWDYGQDNIIFESYDAAVAWVQLVIDSNLDHFNDEEIATASQLFGAGLCSVQRMDVRR